MNFSRFRKLSTIQAAQKLIGSNLKVKAGSDWLVGQIVETEAYLYDDPACHLFRGPTPRTKPMFGPPGFSYVYLIYGMYHCFNVVTNCEGIGEAVLVRAVEPLVGIKRMQSQRLQMKITSLCNGPGKLCEAFGITKKHNNIDLESGIIQIELKNLKKSERILVSQRIGISVGNELDYRFTLAKSPYVSR